MGRKKKNKGPVIDPAFLEKQRKSLVRRHRQVLYLNDSEIAAIEEYCRRFGVSSRSSLYRKAIMEQVLTVLDENHPTLF